MVLGSGFELLEQADCRGLRDGGGQFSQVGDVVFLNQRPHPQGLNFIGGAPGDQFVAPGCHRGGGLHPTHIHAGRAEQGLQGGGMGVLGPGNILEGVQEEVFSQFPVDARGQAFISPLLEKQGLGLRR